MWLIVSLIIIGILLLVAELVLLPGLSVAGIAAVISFGVAIYFGFVDYGAWGGSMVVISIAVTSIAAVVVSLRAKTWQKLALKQQISSTSQALPQDELSVGDKGRTITRLAPIGNVAINGSTYEAKSYGDLYIDPKEEIEVVGFENFNVVVKKI